MAYDLIILGGDPLTASLGEAAVQAGLWTAIVRPTGDAAPELEAIEQAALLDRYAATPRFAGPGRIEVNSAGRAEILEGRRIVIATGARPKRPSEVRFDGWRTCDVLQAGRRVLPRSAVIVGAGRNGLRQAEAWARLGCSVRVVDQRPASRMDLAERELLKNAESAGAACFFSTEVVGVRSRSEADVTVFARNRLPVRAETVVFAVGNVGNTADLELHNAGLFADEWGRIWCDESGRTWNEAIYAVGDVVGFHEDVRQPRDLRRFLLGMFSDDRREAAARRIASPKYLARHKLLGPA